MNRVTITAITAILLGTAAQLPGDVVTPCGPGADWVDTCIAGTYTFDNWTSTGTVNGNTVTLTGTAQIHVDASSGGQFNTELLSLDLSDGAGTSLTLAGSPALGGVTEQPDTFHASSFFDVFFDLTIPGPGTLHNNDPAVLTDVVTEFPDSSATESLSGPISLFASDGTFVGTLTSASETPGDPLTFVADTPEPSTLLLAGLGAAAILLSRRRRA